MEVTVKTLDSRNHKYSVPDEITVKEFKDRIASSVSIPADKQRLIYCGRVLQDDKKLSEYDVHEKVIHLVMRAPPQASTSSVCRIHNQSSNANSGDSSRRSRAAASTRGPSSSGVRLNQAKTMLDKASEVIDQLEELFPSASVNDKPPETRVNDTTESASDAMEESLPEPSLPEPSLPEPSLPEPSLPEPSTSSEAQGPSTSATQPSENKDIPPSTLTSPATIPNEDLQSLFTEMDVLNNSYSYNSMDSGIMSGPTAGLIGTSLASGLSQAASAALISALSMNGAAPSGESEQGRNDSAPSTPSATRRATTTTSGNTGTSTSRQSTPTTSTSSSSHPPGNARGITLRITNRSPRSPTLRLEHPRCNVMVQVFDRYQDVNRRLQPFLHHFYTVIASDPSYENETDPRMRSDQYVIWRVSAAMHFLSHAMHAISDIIIDLRRTPPRQLRARPIIIPQPAIVQTQINLTSTSDPPIPLARSTASQSSSTTTTTTTRSSPSSTNVPRPTPTMSSMSNLSRNLLDNFDDGMVVMHVGPSGFSIDSLADESSEESTAGNHPRELLQNLMSTLTSQFGMDFEHTTPRTTASSSQASSASPPTTPDSVRIAALVRNSQAGGNSGTNTTNATHTRVTPRPHVHVTPVHMPGMGMSQFDPFLPCSSHHIRQAGRRRHRATMQTQQSNTSARTNSQNQQEPGTVPITSTSSSATTSRVSPEGFMIITDSDIESMSFDTQSNLNAHLVQAIATQIIIGVRDLALTQTDSTNFFARLFNSISQSISLRDLVQLFCGGSTRLSQFRNVLQNSFRTHIFNGDEETEENMNRGIEAVMTLIRPYVAASSGDANVNEGIDYTSTVQNFIRQNLQWILTLMFDSENESTFGADLCAMLIRFYENSISLFIRMLSDGISGLERLIGGRMNAITAPFMSASVRAMALDVLLRHIRLVISRGISITDSQFQQYVVAPDAVQSQETKTDEMSVSEASSRPQDEDSSSNDNNYMEAMEVNDIGYVEEVATSEVSIVPEESPLTVGSRPWHSAVPQDWIPVITRDVDRQRNVRTDNSLSDGYLCGMPVKRRKIATQNKPHGNVHQVMQDNLRQSLRTSGVNRSLIESVSGEVTNELSDSFVSHIRSTLRDQLTGNQDFIPEKFPKSEQEICKKQ